MNVTRIVVFCIALMAAGAAVVLVRGMAGGGPPPAEASLPPPETTTDVLIASQDILAGRALDPGSVRWEAWPKESISDAFIVKTTQPDIEKAVSGIVVRVPIVKGQPITDTLIVRAGSAGFLAAMLTPGMRALAIPVSAESGVGGFILPNDRVDVIFTRAASNASDNSKSFLSDVLLHDVRVLAIDQSVKPPGDNQSVVGKTATLEVTLRQAELVQKAHAFGTLSLALRPLGDSGEQTLTNDGVFEDTAEANSINVIRYGIARNASVTQESAVQ